jgi:hypothetical protein
MSGYPEHLAGEPAPAPEDVPARVLAMAAKAHGKHLDRLPPLFGAAGWPSSPRPASSLVTLLAETNAAAPGRSKRSDGLLGDKRHQDLGSATDHNPWIKVAGVGVVRAFDITSDPVLALPTVFERLRARAAAGTLPQVIGDGYAILNGRITAPDWSGWRVYTGADPHVSHGHVSVSRDPARFDLATPWGVFSSEHAPPAPAPPPSPPAGWTGPDLAGSGNGLRGQAAGQPQGPQSNGPRVAALQGWLNANYPAYSHLLVDGWFGVATAGVLREFAARSGIAGADGLNIGPQLAAALARAGFGLSGAPAPPPPARERSSARDRVLRHVGRGTRR